MVSPTPVKVKSSKILATLYIYAKQLQLLDEEITRTKNDQNIATCRDEYISSIWGEKLGQVITSDFTITEYRNLLLKLVKISFQDSVVMNIKDIVQAYFPLIHLEKDVIGEYYDYLGDYTFLNQPVVSISQVRVNVLITRPPTDYQLIYSTKHKLHFVTNVPTFGRTVRVSYVSFSETKTDEFIYLGDHTFYNQPVSSITEVKVSIGDSGTATAGTSGTQIVDSTKTWTPDEWVGYRVVVHGKGAGIITTNSATVLTVTISPAPASGDLYDIDSVVRPDTDYELVKDTTVNGNTAHALDKLKFIANLPSQYDDVYVDYVHNEIANILEFWRDPEDMLGYNWQNTSFVLRGASSDYGTATAGTDGTKIVDSSKSWTTNQWVGFGVRVNAGVGTGTITANTSDTLTVSISPAPVPTDTYSIGDLPILGNEFQPSSGNRPIVPNIKDLAHFLFGVQIMIKNISASDVPKIEKYVIPEIENFIRPAGVYYKLIVTDVELAVPERDKESSVRYIPWVDSILGFGMMPFGSPILLTDNTNTTLPVGNPVIINGVTINADDRVLFTNLTDPSENNRMWKAVGSGTDITSWEKTGDWGFGSPSMPD